MIKSKDYISNIHRMKQGFTLAEVLVTLVIIGVIAALTIPSLVYNVNKAMYVTQLQKSYSALQQAFNLLEMDNCGSIISIFSDDTTTSEGNGRALNAFLTKLNYVKNCGNSMGCWYNAQRYYLGGTLTDGGALIDDSWDGYYEKAILSDGSMILFSVLSTGCTEDGGSGPLDNTVCATMAVDINGAKGPNTIGRDYFVFWITKNGIYPKGSHDDGYTCNTSSSTFATSWGCTAKVLTENAMNY